MIKIAATSDLHGSVDFLTEYSSDIELLILAGDICSSDVPQLQQQELPIIIKELWKSFSGLQEILIIPGNHDYWLERNYQSPPSILSILGGGVKILVDELYTYRSYSSGENIKIYGSPRTSLMNHAFPHLSGNLDISRIPEGVDILVTHEAPRVNGMKCITESAKWYEGEKPGNQYLYEKVLEISPKIHIFGHIHFPCDYVENGINFYNVSRPCVKIFTV